HNRERQIFVSRLLIGGGVAIVLLMMLIARLVFLQVYQHEYYSTKSDSYRISIQPVVPNRGLIYDRNGVILAENKPSYTLTVVKEHAAEFDRSLELLRTLIRLTPDDEEGFADRQRRRAVPFSSVPLRFNLTEEERANIAINQFQLPGISVESELVRHYPQGDLMAHALGYVAALSEEDLQLVDRENYAGTHQIGKMGVEKFYEDTLHGRVGYETVEKNARGQIMKVLSRSDPVPGEDIMLHLDSKLQRAAVEALGDYRGGIVALDPETGGVLAMVSKPSFDPNLFVGGISKTDYAKLQDRIETPLFNRALARYSPGSTIKPFLGLAALDTGIRTREYTIRDNGRFHIGSNVWHDWTWWDNRSGHDIVNLEKAIYQSCDIYFYDLATDMDIDVMHDFLYQFGFGRNTSVDIPQANIGILPSRAWKRETKGESWYPGETVNSSIGQGYTEATPLQLATATMLMANKGKWNPPALLKRIGLDAPDVQHEHQMPDIQLKNPSDWDFIQHAMESVVHKDRSEGYRTNGTAYDYIANAKDNPLKAYHMGGKSGTAQVINHAADFKKGDGKALPEIYRDHGLFIAFAPVEAPKIAVAIFVQNGESGSNVAGTMARRILDAYLLGPDGQLKPEFQPPVLSSSTPLMSLNP
ncbi:MAG: penicillin-binding protein 2, partial [Pseudomonadota bacterium]|nr:penicillin-binding protein 2 [Pseudomonadota bacterium]